MRPTDLPGLILTSIAGIFADRIPDYPGRPRPQPWMDHLTPTPNLPGDPITDDQDASPSRDDSTAQAARRLIEFHSSR